MELNENNYFSDEAKKIYTGSSEIKRFYAMRSGYFG